VTPLRKTGRNASEEVPGAFSVAADRSVAEQRARRCGQPAPSASASPPLTRDRFGAWRERFGEEWLGNSLEGRR
jgi:hypothetical protein